MEEATIRSTCRPAMATCRPCVSHALAVTLRPRVCYTRLPRDTAQALAAQTVLVVSSHPLPVCSAKFTRDIEHALAAQTVLVSSHPLPVCAMHASHATRHRPWQRTQMVLGSAKCMVLRCRQASFAAAKPGCTGFSQAWYGNPICHPGAPWCGQV